MVSIDEVSNLIFDLTYATNDCLYIELVDILGDYDIVVESIEDLDARVYIHFFDNVGSGCLVVDKICKEFTIEAKIGIYYYPPIIGDLKSVINTYVRTRDEGKRLAGNRSRLRPKN